MGAIIGLAVVVGAAAAQAQLRGHGGPVRAIAVADGGRAAVTGSFDTSAILWSLDRGSADQVFRFHDGAVNAIAVLVDGRIATSGEDARIAVWRSGAPAPEMVLQGHTAPVAALAASPNGRLLASASFDRTVRLWPLSGDPPRVLDGHNQNVNGVAFSPDGRSVISAGYDLTVRIWPLADAAAPIIVTLPSPLNSVAVAGDGEIVTGGADGQVYVLSALGDRRGEMAAGTSPIIALAVSPDRSLIAAAGIRGSVSIFARSSQRLERTLVGPGLPVWSLAFLPDSRTLLTGGTDRLVRRWNALTGDHIGDVAMSRPEDPLARYAGDRGADVYRACVACHTLNGDEGNRAGPTLAGIFGRRIAALPNYDFSPALKNLDIVWTPETLARLFEVGPAAYTPGTKMPEQVIGAKEDRDALIRFLEKTTVN